MIVATALLLQALPPPPPARFGSHPYPAQKSQQTTTGQCGRQDADVRITTQAGTPTRHWHQAVEVSIAGKGVPGEDELRIGRAVAAFGIVSSVQIDCVAGLLARLTLHGPVSGPDQGKQMIVNFDRGRVTDVR